MQVTIKEKSYNVNFGIRFIRELDKKHSDGQQYSAALQTMVGRIYVGDTIALQEVIYTAIEGKKPTQDDMDYLIDSCEDIDALKDEVIEELKKSNASRLQTKTALQIMAQTLGRNA